METSVAYRAIEHRSRLTAALDGICANEPIYYGLIASAVVYVADSLLSHPTDPGVMRAWQLRIAGQEQDGIPKEVLAGR